METPLGKAGLPEDDNNAANGAASSPPQAPFDYASLDAALANEARAAAERIHDLGSQQTTAILGIGRELIAIKEKLGHGNFGRWIAAEFGMSADTAGRYMQIARTFG